jgi:tetratricopeptide (TPR) repeat protein
MIEPRRVLEPLDQAGDAIERLAGYEDAAELGGAVADVWDAAERSLRLLLRADRDATDAIRLAALSRAELSFSRVIEELRQRELISYELAGAAHELHQAAARAARGEVRASDADLARSVAERLRDEVNRAAERPVRTVASEAAREASAEPAHAVPAAVPSTAARRLALPAAIVAALVIVIVAVVLIRRGGDGMGAGVEAFRAGQLQVAESRFREVARRDPTNVSAHLYLARIYRRQERFESAAESLRVAARVAPDDPAVLRELGYLFLDLKRPAQAAQHFQRAVEREPEERLNWLGLVRSLREAGDLRAEEVLRRAPADVRAALGTAEPQRGP